MGLGIFTWKHPNRLVARNKSLQEDLGLLIQSNILNTSSFCRWQGQHTPLHIDIFPAKAELFLLAHAPQNCELNPGRIARAQFVSQSLFLFHREKASLARRLLEQLYSIDWITGNLAITKGLIQHSPQKFEVVIHCSCRSPYYQLGARLFKASRRERIQPRPRKQLKPLPFVSFLVALRSARKGCQVTIDHIGQFCIASFLIALREKTALPPALA